VNYDWQGSWGCETAYEEILMFKRTQARKEWHAYKQRWPMVEKTQGFVSGFGSRLDEADAKGKASIEAIDKCKQALKELVGALTSEIDALTTLAYAVTVNDGVVKKCQAAHSAPLERGILPMWTKFVQDNGLDDVANTVKLLKDLKAKMETSGSSIAAAHGLLTRG